MLMRILSHLTADFDHVQFNQLFVVNSRVVFDPTGRLFKVNPGLP